MLPPEYGISCLLYHIYDNLYMKNGISYMVFHFRGKRAHQNGAPRAFRLIPLARPPRKIYTAADASIPDPEEHTRVPRLPQSARKQYRVGRFAEQPTLHAQ